MNSNISTEELHSKENLQTLISDKIRKRLVEKGAFFFSNDNLSEFIEAGELEQLEEEVAFRFRDLLKSLIIDIDNDHNTKETAFTR